MNDTTQWLGERWASALADVIASLAGERPTIETARNGDRPSDAFWWQQELTGSACGSIWAGAAKTDWFGIGQWILGRAGIETVEETDARNTWMEVAGQSAIAIASDIGTRLRGRVETGEGAGSAPPAHDATTAWFRLDLIVKDAAWVVWVVFSPSLIEALEPGCEAAADLALATVGNAEPAVSGGRDEEQHEAGRQVAPKALDLLLDVELPVSVSFGRAELPLKDVLKLTTGAIVELNRTISDPVEVIVNNCVIARGEVVVVEGNYGVRIREIVSREHRMRSVR